ncbi:MAG: ECF transporter S component [Angelakisella sp.]|nr:ECF transporter S component [Angelakisella sp.]
MKKITVKQMVLGGLFLALGIVMPFLTAQIPGIGSRLLPMHIPVLLCGFVCGGPVGLLVGFVVPILRSMMFGMPPMFPTAIAMAFELAVYGWLCGVLYQRLPKTTPNIYLSLIGAMLGGRIVWGLISLVLYGMAGNPFSLQIFMAGAFINAAPGILLQLVLIPIIVVALRKAKQIPVKA